jgi:nucleoside-diphosphate-sugar epimerase
MTTSRPAFVTGASGFIGRHLVRTLLMQERRVVALCRHPTDLEELAHPLLQVITGQIEDPQTFNPYLNDEVVVFHLAATRATPGTPPELFERVNELAALELGGIALKADVSKFVHVSTALTFGPSRGESVGENSTWDWRSIDSCYVRTRAKSQKEMMQLVLNGLPLVVVCPTLVYGPDHPSHPNQITQQIRRLIRTRLDLVIDGGNKCRNLVYIDDVIQGILLVEQAGNIGEEFIIGGQDCSHREFNNIVYSLSGLKSRISLSIPLVMATFLVQFADRVRGFHPGSGYNNALQTLTQEWSYTSQKAERLLGYTYLPVQDGIRKTLDSFERVDKIDKQPRSESP